MDQNESSDNKIVSYFENQITSREQQINKLITEQGTCQKAQKIIKALISQIQNRVFEKKGEIETIEVDADQIFNGINLIQSETRWYIINLSAPLLMSLGYKPLLGNEPNFSKFTIERIIQ